MSIRMVKLFFVKIFLKIVKIFWEDPSKYFENNRQNILKKSSKYFGKIYSLVCSLDSLHIREKEK